MEAHDLQGILRGLEELQFHELAPFNGGTAGVYWASGGTSPWERHPEEDELLLVLDGRVDVTVLTDDGPAVTPVGAGGAFVVPRGHWHRQTLHGRVQQLYVTPGRTEHSTKDHPRR